MKEAKYISNGTITYKIVAEQGPQGPQGPQGDVGPQGPQGPQGPEYDDTELITKINDINKYKENKHTNEVIITDYIGLVANSDWKDAIDQAFSDVPEGGIIRFPAGRYVTSKQFPTSKSIIVSGDNYLNTILQYSGNQVDGAFFDIRVDGYGINNITIYGYSKSVSTSQDCSGIWLRQKESEKENPSSNEVAISGTQLYNVRVRYFKQDGIKIFPNVWMNYYDKLYCYNNDGIGLNIPGTDSCFSNIHCVGNGSHGIYVGGGNNRFVNVNCIRNAETNVDGAEIYVKGHRHSLTNIACQDGNHHGIIFEGCNQCNIDILSDAVGLIAAAGEEDTKTAYGVQFKNNCNNITGIVRLTNYRNDEGTKNSLYIDNTCKNINIKYFDVSRSENGVFIGNDVYNKVENCYEELENKIKNAKVTELIDSTMSQSGTLKYVSSVVTATVTDGVASVTIDGTQPNNKFIQIVDGKTEENKNNLFYYSVEVSTTTENLAVNLFNNTSATPAYSFGNKRKVPTDGEWHKFTWLAAYNGDTTKFYIVVKYDGSESCTCNIRNPRCFDVTASMGLKCNPDSSTITQLPVDDFDSLLTKYNI